MVEYRALRAEGEGLHYQVRPMEMRDIPQVAELEKEVFPTDWPPTSFKRELQNKIAHYQVAYANRGESEGEEASPTPQPPEGGLVGRLKHFLGWRNHSPAGSSSSAGLLIVGVVGFWLMLDEAHITIIAVHDDHRRQGIGELLLIQATEQAQKLGAEKMTLEVRASNTGAQALYQKYGFEKAGVRPRYYSDNHEDGFIMTTDRITSASYQARFQRLKEALAQRWQRSLG